MRKMQAYCISATGVQAILEDSTRSHPKPNDAPTAEGIGLFTYLIRPMTQRREVKL